jgi:hypothetical protein
MFIPYVLVAKVKTLLLKPLNHQLTINLIQSIQQQKVMILPIQKQKSIRSIKHAHASRSGGESEDIAVETTEVPASNKLDSAHSTEVMEQVRY